MYKGAIFYLVHAQMGFKEIVHAHKKFKIIISSFTQHWTTLTILWAQ